MELRPILRIDRDAWRDTALAHNAELTEGNYTPELDETFDSFFLPKSSPNRVFCYVAFENGKMVGFMNMLLHVYPFWRGPMLYIADLYVDPEYRRRGLCRAMLDEAMQFGRDVNATYVWWMTRANHPVRPLFDQYAGATETAMYCAIYGDANEHHTAGSTVADELSEG